MEFAPWHTDLAKETLMKRYFKKDENGNCIEDWPGMCRRVAKHVASAEKEEDREEWEDRFYALMVNGIFLPNSPTLMNAGIGGGLSACYVIPIEDSMDKIFDSLKHAALISQSGGGVGCNYSPLRPKGALVGKQNRASGPISFMSVFDAAGVIIEQSGRRRGANMGVLNVTHPDILRFIRAKGVDGTFKNFNFSVAITDDFMNAMLDSPDQKHICFHEKTGECYLTEDGEWHYVNSNELPDEAVSVGRLFEIICEHAHKNGEPGVIFIDTVNTSNLANYQKIVASNPCGEQMLPPYGSCNLGSIDVSKLYHEGFGRFDYDALKRTVRDAVRFLDDVVSINEYPLPEIAKMAEDFRPIGLGLMGYADLLIKLGLVYGSPEAIEFTEILASTVANEAEAHSMRLSDTKGAYPRQALIDIVDWGKGIRNAELVSYAPTGTLSIMAGCSSGIEPNFYWEYLRRTNDGEWVIRHPLARPFLESGQPLPECFVTGSDVAWEDHIRTQVTFQKYCDSSISKTINMPSDATVQDVKDAYIMAWCNGCKGLTVYRDESRGGQVISSTGKSNNGPTQDGAGSLARGVIAKRPRKTNGSTSIKQSGCSRLYITCNEDPNGDPCEVFVRSVGGGGCEASLQSTGILISVALRAGIPMAEIARSLSKVRCSACRGNKTDGKSCSDIIGRTMMEAFGPLEKSTYEVGNMSSAPDESNRPCPDCGTELRSASGCWSCDNCGFSKCG